MILWRTYTSNGCAIGLGPDGPGKIQLWVERFQDSIILVIPLSKARPFAEELARVIAQAEASEQS